ncbi:CotD family spore coat protein [Peribacillus sp. CSMR9]|uniref:CotD family spore coat protein n=1 Tax=Peribacillus sp. CSMR9 TaxID=2981350 RepID=UPI002954B4E6|nr:CotD family spore coat protein [Peribacillus sp. CSMR9]MDV7765114.1 spore coat protein [Peribacillus sp. CSMR9]
MYFRNCGGNKSNVMGAYGNAPGVMGASTGKHKHSNVMGAYTGPTAVSPAQLGPTQALPTQLAPAQVSPTQQFVNTNVSNTVIPVVHPSHTTTVNKHLNTYKHYFPHTQSVVNQCFTQNLICGRPPINPCCPPTPFGY